MQPHRGICAMCGEVDVICFGLDGKEYCGPCKDGHKERPNGTRVYNCDTIWAPYLIKRKEEIDNNPALTAYAEAFYSHKQTER